MTHSEYANDLRKIADFIEAHNEIPLPESTLTCYGLHNKPTFALVARALSHGGRCEKLYEDTRENTLTSPSSLDSKVLEVRDSATHIPVLAIRMLAKNGIQRYYIHERYGYPADGSCIAVIRLLDCDGNCDPYAWGGSRTMGHAHHYIYEHFDELSDGDVVDVEFILGETTVKKVSKRLTIHPTYGVTK